MVTERKALFPILLMIGLGICCGKKELPCPKMGYEFTYDKPSAIYTPSIDSFMLGNEIFMEASVPKTFFDEENRYNVTLNETLIKGSLGIQKFTDLPGGPIDFAADDFEFISILGEIYRDTVNHTEGQLKGSRTLLWASVLDSFKIKIKIKPKVRGTYILGTGQFGNRDADCALYKYFVKVKNYNQHLYYYLPYYGFIPNDDYAYCFKVY